MPRSARHVHLYLAAIDGVIVASVANRRPAACMRTGTSALPANGNGNAAGTSNNPGNASGGNAGGGNSGGGVGAGNGSGGNTNGGGGAGQGNGREFIYFYHPDHLGSTGYVTDEKALRYEHITYFPFGETWVQESNATWRVPYQFTSKEMDQETGLYYFGARYYDPRTSVWQSADPIDRFNAQSPTMGLNLYHYKIGVRSTIVPKL